MKTIERVEVLIKSLNISISKFEKLTNMSNNSIQTAIKRNSNLKDETLNSILTAYPQINPTWLLTGVGSMLKDKLEEMEFVAEECSCEINSKGIPIYDLIAGTNYVANSSEPYEYMNAGDLFVDAHAIMRVYGDSMEPQYPSGCYVPIKKLENKALVIFGQDYVIQTTEYRVLKRLQKSKEQTKYLACSINQEIYQNGELAGKLIHEPFSIPIDDILSISIVLGCVTRTQIVTIRS